MARAEIGKIELYRYNGKVRRKERQCKLKRDTSELLGIKEWLNFCIRNNYQFTIYKDVKRPVNQRHMAWVIRWRHIVPRCPWLKKN